MVYVARRTLTFTSFTPEADHASEDLLMSFASLYCAARDGMRQIKNLNPAQIFKKKTQFGPVIY